MSGRGGLIGQFCWLVGWILFLLFCPPAPPSPSPSFHDNESDWFVLYCRGKGVVVNISSAAGMAPMALISLYSATKVCGFGLLLNCLLDCRISLKISVYKLGQLILVKVTLTVMKQLKHLSYEALLVAGQELVQFITHYMKKVGCVYDIDHMYVLRIENTSESDPHSYEATKAVEL